MQCNQCGHKIEECACSSATLPKSEWLKLPDEIVVPVPNNQVAEQIEKLVIGVETDLRYGVDIPVPDLIGIECLALALSLEAEMVYNPEPKPRPNLDRDMKQRVADLLLAELKCGEREWYYISLGSDNKAHGGAVINAFGPTDAWRLMHTLDLYPQDASPGDTQTFGPISAEIVAKIPENQRWKLLTKKEANNLGK